jgi:hypothetical protein
MKWLKLTSIIIAMFSITIAVTGCGGDDGEAPKTGGIPGSPGNYYGGGVLPPGTPVPAGQGVAVDFTATQPYNDNSRIVAGPLNAPGCHPATTYSPYNTSWVNVESAANPVSIRYYDTFSLGTGNWPFVRWNYTNGGSISMGRNFGAGQGMGFYAGSSMWESGAKLEMWGSLPSSSAQYGYPISQSLAGTITLPATFTQRLAGKQIINVSLDLSTTDRGQGQFEVHGGILLYTGLNSNGCYSGYFLRL